METPDIANIFDDLDIYFTASITNSQCNNYIII